MLIGRVRETELLRRAAEDDVSHFIAVYGRRRIGKTFLIREAFGYRFTFQHAGLSEGSRKEQLFAFAASLKDAGMELRTVPKNWLEAFELLKDRIRQSTEKKKVIFIDELSWMDTQKSDLMAALENFWNGWASGRKDVVLIICASATSWMLSKVIHNKGGLYNRLTEQIHLEPFQLAECEELVRANGLLLNREQILQGYMILGGVPYYWGLLQKGLSMTQNVDALFFAKDAPLRDEFKYLYASVFKNPEIHQKIIRALGKKKAGMTRDEIIDAARVSNSGDLSLRLDELESCGFIRKYYAFGRKKKNAVYQLLDNFTLFHFRFLDEAAPDEHFWSNQINTAAVNTWMGLAFERVCLEHIAQIKQKLGISGVLTDVNSWHCRADPALGLHGSQIDLLIVRRDQVINLCEMKYSQAAYTITEKTARAMQTKISDLRLATETKYAIHPTYITTYGLAENTYAQDVQAAVTMEDLFRRI